jgi:glycosyltransferase involved in cell wall biosynthesis
MTLRLLFLTAETCPTFRPDVAALFGKYLPRFGIQSDIVAGKTPEHHGDVIWGGGETCLCDTSGGQAKKYVKTFLHGIKHLLFADKQRYQAIQVRDLPITAFLALVIARFKGLKFFYWMSYPVTEGQINRARQRGLSAGIIKFIFPLMRGHVGHFLLYQLVLRYADHVFVQSERMRADVAIMGVAMDKMTPVPMGVDTEAVQPELIQPADDQRIHGKRAMIYLGSLDRPRHIELLFRMLGIVQQQIPNALLVLVGDTKDEMHRCWLQDQAKKDGVSEAIIWTGWQPMQEGWRYVRACEVGLSPIPRGTLLDCSSPTKVAEYLTLGIPIVANDSPDQELIIREGGGGYCVPYSPENFAEAVIALLSSTLEQRSSMAQRGRAYIERNRSYEAIARQVALTFNSQFQTQADSR